MSNKIEGLGQGNKHPKEYWNCVNIKLGFNVHSKKVSEPLFRKGVCPDEWLKNRSKKNIKEKGDLRNLDNWRGIMLIESPVKVITSILASRISVHVLETEGLEEQIASFVKEDAAMVFSQSS